MILLCPPPFSKKRGHIVLFVSRSVGPLTVSVHFLCIIKIKFFDGIHAFYEVIAILIYGINIQVEIKLEKKNGCTDAMVTRTPLM